MPKDTLSVMIDRELAEDAAAIAVENARLRALVEELAEALADTIAGLSSHKVSVMIHALLDKKRKETQ
jgi:biopolymer transport protein ExbB/TolQ